MRVLRIDHVTEYRFAGPVTLSPHRLMLRPRESHQLRIVSSSFDIQPRHEVRWQRDVLDNSIALVSFLDAASTVRIGSSVVIEHYDDAPLDFVVEERAVSHPFSYLPEENVLLAPFHELSWPRERASVDAFLTQHGFGQGTEETYLLLSRLNRAVNQSVRYQVREEAGVQSPAQTLGLGAGACRDLAALFMDACRALGLACRFVSGYLPGPGWKGFDPTLGELTGNQHIAVAVARHPGDVPPVSGSFGAPLTMGRSMHVYVRVRPEP